MRIAGALLVALVALGGTAEGARAQAECPATPFLQYEGLVYVGEAVPADVQLAAGASLGAGRVDQPIGDDPCQRERNDVEVVRAGDLDPRIAVLVQGRDAVAFVLGRPCAGYEDEARWECLLSPLDFEGTTYTARRYPEPGKELRLAAPLGSSEVGDVVAIEGVDPAVAVAVEGRPLDAFIAPGACPYERFALEPTLDDLRRCLESPVWLTFDPPGERVGEEVAATSDRATPSVLEGAIVTLARLLAPGDRVPADVSKSVEIGTIAAAGDGRATFAFTVPELEAGVYEAVIVCQRCAASYGGRALFPAGSLLVGEERGSGGSFRWIGIGIGVAFIAALGLAIATWRRRRAASRRSGPAAP